jgi:hypothetical protein
MSNAQKLWFLLNKLDRSDQSELSQDKLLYPYFYLLHWNERYSILKQQRIALQSSQRKQYFQSIHDIQGELVEVAEPIPAEFILNQPTLAKPKRSEIEDFPQEDLSATEFSLPISETVAILLTKQGKYLQAIELYEKLSLIKPEKRLYFASRISELQNLLTE